MKSLLVCLAFMLMGVVPAATAGTALLTWAAPTQNTDGTPITAPLTYRVYGAVQGAAKTVITTVSALTYTHSSAPNGVTYCYQVSAVASGVESALSAEGCKVMPPAIPNPPTNLMIATTSPTAYKMRQAVDSYSMLAIGTVPLATPCDATRQVDIYNVIPRSAVRLASRFDSLPLVVFGRCG